jgi:triacylglycerol lipase
MSRFLSLLLTISLHLQLFYMSSVYSAYSEKTSNIMVHFAAAAYCDPPALATWDCTQCEQVEPFHFDHYFYNGTTDIFGYSGHSDKNKSIVFSFRGTRSVQNGILDFTFFTNDQLLIPYDFDKSGKSKVHTGFWVAYKSIREQVEDAIESYMANPAFKQYTIYVTGHSLGGALSHHGAVHVKVKTGRSPVLYNYGSPRVGDKNFVSFFHHTVPNSYRTINNSDPVPRLPPRCAQEGGTNLPIYCYRHAPQEIW